VNPTQLVTLPVWLIVVILILAILWFVFQRQYEHTLTRQRAMEETLAEQRHQLYKDFVDKFWAPTTTGKIDEDAAVNFLRDWSRTAWLVSSDEVVKAMIRVIAGTSSQEESLMIGGRLFVAMRKDMGNPTQLSVRDWMRLTIKRSDWVDIEKSMATRFPDRTRTKSS
jgi:hypothetical protein